VDKNPGFAAALALFAALLAAPAWPAEKYCDKNHYILSLPCESPSPRQRSTILVCRLSVQKK
jgi:hypothetical protein